MSFTTIQRAKASQWKMHTTTLPDAARAAAPYARKPRTAGRAEYPFCLPLEYARNNLLPDVREEALDLFEELRIPWHAGIDGGPTNHLLSSQVQCVNALTAMVRDPERIKRAFGRTVSIDEVLEIEPGRFLTFEYVGPSGHDYLHESINGVLLRGAHCTSIDAAFMFRNTHGEIELALVEWKFTESYRKRKPDPDGDAVRCGRYSRLYEAPKGPLHQLVPLPLLFDEPFYQLMRQQLLAFELERHHAAGADIVRVLHVLDPANAAYQGSIAHPTMRALGDTVDEIWSRLLRDSSRFLHVDPTVFLDPTVTSEDYVARYGDGR